MDNGINRRDFMKVLAATPFAASYRLNSLAAFRQDLGQVGSGSKDLLEPFNYGGVRLLDGMLKTQYQQMRDYYFNVPDDDILKGFRRQAGLPAPGRDLGGWCSENSYVVFGQWLSGMARMYKATGDAAMLDKAQHLLREWSKTIDKPKLGHYLYDKTICGLIDLVVYAGQKDALPLLERTTDCAIENLGRTRNRTSFEDHSGDKFVGEGEWYTLSENLYRAYQCTKDPKYKAFGDVWRYPHYWGMFTGKVPLNLKGMHAYSHVNSLSSAAMSYAITGEPEYLKTIVNAYDYFQAVQCYATGGFGPGEMLMPEDGTLGRSVEDEPGSFFGHWPHLYYDVGRTFETPCGSWAVFKLCRYLMQFTGEARYGDWMERILYNGIGAALPMSGPGRTFYYSDYRLGGGSKVYYGAAWPCCSGTYIQAVTDYHNIIYFKDPSGLYVNLFVPSEVAWNQMGEEIKIVQTTTCPESETTSLTIQMKKRARFSLRLRVPGWGQGATVELNGAKLPVVCRPGAWATMDREWDPGDRVEFRIPMQLKLTPVDKQHPNLVALAYGPVVLVQSQESPYLPIPSDFSKWLVPGERPLAFRSQWQIKGIFEPFYRAKFGIPYRMYFQV
jgi:hypothetical protein